MKHNKPKVFINSDPRTIKTRKSTKNTLSSIVKLQDQIDTGLQLELDTQNVLRGEEVCRETSGLEGGVCAGDTVYGMGITGANTSGVWNSGIGKDSLPGKTPELQKEFVRSGVSPGNVTVGTFVGSKVSGEEKIIKNFEMVVPRKIDLFTELDIIDS
jgi:hypothetical protein